MRIPTAVPIHPRFSLFTFIKKIFKGIISFTSWVLSPPCDGFIAGAPFDTPRLVVLCVIEDPDKRIGPYYGGLVAGPVVRDVMDYSLGYLGVPSDLDTSIARTD